MKTIIAGSRTITDYTEVCLAVEASGFHITEVVCGGARGVDELGARWAATNDIPVIRFNANWATHGKSAGRLRNQQMAEYADALIAVWADKSKGTADMIQQASQRNLATYVRMVGNKPEPSVFDL